MPTRPLSHEQRQRQARAHTAEAQAQRQASNAAYAQRRRELHGPDPRSTARWQRLRLWFLARNPVCKDIYGIHKGEPVPATEVDHVIPLWTRVDLAYDPDNLSSLCSQCHGIKSGRERRINKE